MTFFPSLDVALASGDVYACCTRTTAHRNRLLVRLFVSSEFTKIFQIVEFGKGHGYKRLSVEPIGSTVDDWGEGGGVNMRALIVSVE